MMKILFLSLMSLILVSSNAMAQEDQTFVAPGNIWVNKAEQQIKILNAQALKEEGGVVPSKVHLSVVKYDYMDPDQFGILMKAPESITGCFEVSPLSYEASYIADLFMDVNIKSYTVKPVETQNVTYECNQGYQAAAALMVLSVEDLKSRGTQQIRFTNGEIRDNYDIIYGENSITLKPRTMIAFKADEGHLKYSMGGGNIIALQIPMAKDGDIVAQEILTLAAKNALTPITDMSAFNLEERKNVFYYIDENGRFNETINSAGYVPLGEIPVARPIMNENGVENVTVPLKVFVTKHNHTL